MADPVTTTEGSTVPPVQSTSGTTADESLANTIAAAVAAGVQTAMQQFAMQTASASAQTQQFQTTIADALKSLQSQFDQLSNRVETANATDSDSGYLVRSSVDPADNQARLMKQRDEVGTVALKMLSDMAVNNDALMKEFLKYTAAKWTDQANYQAGVWTRSLDHFSSLPPIAPRSPTGPGTTAG